MMKWFIKLVAFKAYRGKLRKQLYAKFKKSSNLKYSEVKGMLEELKLEGEFDCYAYAMSLTKSQYKHYQELSGVIYTQEALRVDLGVSKELLKTQYFPGGESGGP